MNMNIATTTNTKRAGLFMAICAAFFALTLIVTPAQVQAGDSVYNDSGLDWGYDSGYNSSGLDWGYPETSGWGGYSDSGSNYNYYDTPVYGYSSGSYNSPSYQYSQPSSGSYSGFGENYTPMRYVQSSTPNYNSNSQGQSQNSSNKNTNNNKSTSSSVSSSNVNNKVTNTNNNQDITNNVNNNNISLVVYAAGATSTYSNVNDTNQQLGGYCVINPTTASVNQDLNFMAYPTGGNGVYSYSWAGSDGLSSNAQNFTGRFGTAGYKTAYVTIRSGSQIITKSCSVNIVQQYVNPQNNQVNAYCVATPSTVGVNQVVTWQVYANGGNGSFGYYWTGTDNLYGYSQSVQKSYSYAGTKQATVTVTSAGQSVSAVCNANVTGGDVSNVTVYRQPTSGTPVSGVFLNQIPATGIEWSMKTTLFSVGLLMWSAFVAYMVIARRKAALTLAASTGTSKEASFKLANMQKKGLIA